MTTTKELKLVFKNADGKHKNMVIAKPAENLDVDRTVTQVFKAE